MKSRFLQLGLLGAALAATALASLLVGRYGSGAGELLSLLQGSEAARWKDIFLEIRLPRILAAGLIGASLAVSGAAYQAVFSNPLVSPNLCGCLAGASFGSALCMSLGLSWGFVQLGGLAGGFLAVGLSLGLAWAFRKNGSPSLLLILGGIVSNACFAALLALVKYTADPYDKLPSIVYWLMGSLALVEWQSLQRVALPFLVCTALLLAGAAKLNVMSLGDETARSLGIPAARLRILVLFCATTLSAVTVLLAGEVGWLGLIVPHITRLLVGPDNRVLLPACALLGAAMLIAVDTVARGAFRTEVPVGILTALVGVVSFVAVFGRARKGWI